MGIYGGIQLQNVNEQSLDDKKERKQILNYLALLDEKLRYMFQNIDIEENFSEESKGMFFEMGKEFKNLVQDADGRFSLLKQTVDGIDLLVSDPEKGLSAISQKADEISTTVYGPDGNSGLVQTAEDIRAMVYDEAEGLSAISQKANRIDMLVTSGSTSSKITLTSNMIKAITEQVDIEADVNLYGKMTVYKDSDLDSKGGYIGYGTIDDLYNGTTKGIMMQDSSRTASFCASSSGCGMVAEGDDDTFGVYLYYYNGNFMPYVKNEQMLGDPSYKWQGVYASNGTIQTSDEREKENITYDMDRYEEFYSMLKPAWYQMVNGQSGRTHVGFISQDIEIALRESGLTDMDFAGFIKSPLYGEDENGLPKHEGEVVDYAYSLRYGEFIALNTHMIQKLMERVTELENKLEALS